MDRDEEWERRDHVPTIVAIAGLLVVLAGIAVLGMQCLGWLREGEWTAFPVSGLAGPPPQGDWLGLNAIVGWVYELPLSLALVVIGVAVALTGANMEDLSLRRPPR